MWLCDIITILTYGKNKWILYKKKKIEIKSLSTKRGIFKIVKHDRFLPYGLWRPHNSQPRLWKHNIQSETWHLLTNIFEYS